MGRVEAWAEGRRPRLYGHNPFLLAVRTYKRFEAARVMGLAAEMAYFALLSLVPLLATLGAGLGLLERVMGTGWVREAERAILVAVEGVFSPQFADDVINPLVLGLLREERAGLALGGLVVTFWFAGGAFRAVIRALDDAYQVEERRGTLSQWGIAYLLTVGAVGVALVVLALVVVGPLLGAGHALAGWLGMGAAFEVAWAVGRWPVVFAAAAAYLALVYRIGPNVENSWRRCLPGAVLGTALIVLVALLFRIYLEHLGPEPPMAGDPSEAVQVVSLTVAAVLASILWIWFTSIAVLIGGIFNAELSRSRGERPVRKA